MRVSKLPVTVVVQNVQGEASIKNKTRTFDKILCVFVLLFSISHSTYTFISFVIHVIAEVCERHDKSTKCILMLTKINVLLQYDKWHHLHHHHHHRQQQQTTHKYKTETNFNYENNNVFYTISKRSGNMKLKLIQLLCLAFPFPFIHTSHGIIQKNIFQNVNSKQGENKK